jgi:hypothetical protein
MRGRGKTAVQDNDGNVFQAWIPDVDYAVFVAKDGATVIVNANDNGKWTAWRGLMIHAKSAGSAGPHRRFIEDATWYPEQNGFTLGVGREVYRVYRGQWEIIT